jgi:hypothetical protein
MRAKKQALVKVELNAPGFVDRFEAQAGSGALAPQKRKGRRCRTMTGASLLFGEHLAGDIHWGL